VVIYIFKHGCDHNRPDHHQPVCYRDVDLTVVLGAGIDHLDGREIAHIDDLKQ
jgi:hypothetical protein